jgi:DNA-directed RNA polymerase specialized sigma24 family protein
MNSTSLLPEPPYAQPGRQTDWFCLHLNRDQDYFALARRLSGSAEDASQIYHLAMGKVIEGGNWGRIISPHAYMMRLIFDIAVARTNSALLPASQYIASQDVGPLPAHERPPVGTDMALNAMQRMRRSNRDILWAWRVEGRSLRELARKFKIEPYAVSGRAAKALLEFHYLLQAAFCDPARVCRRTDAFFGGEVMKIVPGRHRPWWRIAQSEIMSLLMGLNIGIWGGAGISAVAHYLPEMEVWFK